MTRHTMLTTPAEAMEAVEAGERVEVNWLRGEEKWIVSPIPRDLSAWTADFSDPDFRARVVEDENDDDMEHDFANIRRGAVLHPTPQPSRLSDADETLAVLRRLKDALPTVGINGWYTGVKALDDAIRRLALAPPQVPLYTAPPAAAPVQDFRTDEEMPTRAEFYGCGMDAPPQPSPVLSPSENVCCSEGGCDCLGTAAVEYGAGSSSQGHGLEALDYIARAIYEVERESRIGGNEEYDERHPDDRAVTVGMAMAALKAIATYPMPEPQPSHPDDAAVDNFAAAMKAKMAKQRAKGYGGWDDPLDCPADRLRELMVSHIAKGDPVDVGNFAMMLFNRGEPTSPPQPSPVQGDGVDRDDYAELLRLRKIVATPPEVWRGWEDLCKANSAIVDEIREIVLPNKAPGNVVEAVRALAAAQPGGGFVVDEATVDRVQRIAETQHGLHVPSYVIRDLLRAAAPKQSQEGG
jgi:hypothetical protein